MEVVVAGADTAKELGKPWMDIDLMVKRFDRVPASPDVLLGGVTPKKISSYVKFLVKTKASAKEHIANNLLNQSHDDPRIAVLQERLFRLPGECQNKEKMLLMTQLGSMSPYLGALAGKTYEELCLEIDILEGISKFFCEQMVAIASNASLKPDWGDVNYDLMVLQSCHNQCAQKIRVRYQKISSLGLRKK